MNGIETTTWHDRRPSHSMRPGYLLLAGQRKAAAWIAYDIECELRGKPSEATLEDIEQAEADYRAAYARWQEEPLPF
jgi:hypothetical protein